MPNPIQNTETTYEISPNSGGFIHFVNITEVEASEFPEILPEHIVENAIREINQKVSEVMDLYNASKFDSCPKEYLISLGVKPDEIIEKDGVNYSIYKARVNKKYISVAAVGLLIWENLQ